MPRCRASAQRREREKQERKELRRAERERLRSLGRRVIVVVSPHPTNHIEKPQVAITPIPEKQPKLADTPAAENHVAAVDPATPENPEWDDCLQIDGNEFPTENSSRARTACLAWTVPFCCLVSSSRRLTDVAVRFA